MTRITMLSRQGGTRYRRMGGNGLSLSAMLPGIGNFAGAATTMFRRLLGFRTGSRGIG